MVIRILAAATALVGFYFLWWTVSFAQPIWATLGVGLLVTAAGLLLGRRWGAYFWFLLTVGAILWWLAILAKVIESGWPYSTVSESIISLLPGLFLIVVCVGGSVLIYRKEFKRARAP